MSESYLCIMRKMMQDVDTFDLSNVYKTVERGKKNGQGVQGVCAWCLPVVLLVSRASSFHI